MTMPYYNVPISVLENAVELGEWAARAVKVAKAAKVAKPVKVAKPATTRKSD